jgi:hypothetical protein
MALTSSSLSDLQFQHRRLRLSLRKIEYPHRAIGAPLVIDVGADVRTASNPESKPRRARRTMSPRLLYLTRPNTARDDRSSLMGADTALGLIATFRVFVTVTVSRQSNQYGCELSSCVRRNPSAAGTPLEFAEAHRVDAAILPSARRPDPRPPRAAMGCNSPAPTRPPARRTPTHTSQDQRRSHGTAVTT